MNLYHLRHVPWLDSQLIYHAMPRVGVEGIVILAPAEPYVCIGYHQDVEQEVDIDYCREQHIPVFRREVGGGAVYLDGNQIFYQIVLHKDNPLAHGDKAALYRRMLQPVANAYADLGVPARYRPVNDVVTVEGRKVSGTGAAEIGDFIVLVGNLIADFDYAIMSRVLRVPDEKYRDKVFKSMQENLTTLQREAGRAFEWDAMVAPLIRRFEEVCGSFQPATLPQAVYAQVESLKPLFLSDEWLYKRGKAPISARQIGHEVKIATGVNVVRRAHKAAGGLIRATVEIKENYLADVSLSGDFFCYPQDALNKLEVALAGIEMDRVAEAVTNWYTSCHVETPGVTVDDWLKVLGN